MLILPPTLLGICVACLCWILLYHYQSRSLIAGRISGISSLGLSFPYDITKKSPFDSKHADSITLDDSYKDKIGRRLFLAGFRRQGHIRFFHYLMSMGLILSVVLIIFYALTGSLTLKSLTFTVALGGVVAFCIHAVVRKLQQNRQRKISRALPQFLDLLVVCIEAGLNFTAALARLVQEFDPKEPLTQEFKLMHHEFLSGIPLAQTCERLAKRCEVTDLSVILSAIVQSEQMGAALANTLRVQASELRDKHRQRMREKAYKLPIKLIFPALLVFSTIFMVTLVPAIYKFVSQMSGVVPAHAELQNVAGNRS